MSSDDENDRMAIGISFGNSYSSIACLLGGDAQVIANEEGDRQIPSMLSYVQGEEFQGAEAKTQLVRNASNTVAGFRDFLGKKYVKAGVSYLFFNVWSANHLATSFDSIDPSSCHDSARPQAHDSTVAFSLHDTTDESKSSIVSVSEVATRHLRRLKQSASDYLGKHVTSAVLTVPTDFTSSQCDTLTAAAQAAGLEVLQLISEPAAALLAHDRRQANQRLVDKTVVLADLGGSRSDISVISVRGGMYTFLATVHDYALGGVRLDEVLMEHGAKEFLKKYKDAPDPRQSTRGTAKLKSESEATKKALSLGTSANMNIESLVNGLDFSLTVNRTRYDLLANKVFSQFGSLIQDALAKADLDILDIDEVVLAGGTSHTPRIAQNVRAAFPESTEVIAPATMPTEAVNPSEMVARGAAMQAYLVEGFDTEDVEQSTHPAVTATPHLGKTIGFVVVGAQSGKASAYLPNGSPAGQDQGSDSHEAFKPLIPAETPLPVRRTLNFTNHSRSKSPSSILLRLCEGERRISVTKPEPLPKRGKEGKDEAAEDPGSESDDEDEDDEPEEMRDTVWGIGTLLGDLALRDVKPGARVTMQVSVGVDLGVSVSAMEAGKTGVKGTVEGSSVDDGDVSHMNGAAR